MSSAVVSTSAALGRPFLFDEEDVPEVCSLSQSTIINQQSKICPSIGNRKSQIQNSILPASHLAIRPSPEVASSGIPALDSLTGGLPRGCLTEICGPASSGRTTVLLAALAAATHRGEFCVLVDASDALDPQSVAAAGVALDRLLWVRCGDTNSPRKNLSPQRHPSTPLRAGSDTEKTFFEINSGKRIGTGSREYQSLYASINNQESTIKNLPNRQSEIGNRKFSGSASEHRLKQVLRATDLLLESGGFGLIILDLADIPPQSARLIPLTAWFRFRRAVEYKPTILLAIAQHPIAGSCSSLLLQLGSQDDLEKAVGQNLAHTQLLTRLEINAELIHSRLERKPACSVTFTTNTAWAG